MICAFFLFILFTLCCCCIHFVLSLSLFLSLTPFLTFNGKLFTTNCSATHTHTHIPPTTYFDRLHIKDVCSLLSQFFRRLIHMRCVDSGIRLLRILFIHTRHCNVRVHRVLTWGAGARVLALTNGPSHEYRRSNNNKTQEPHEISHFLSIHSENVSHWRARASQRATCAFFVRV